MMHMHWTEVVPFLYQRLFAFQPHPSIVSMFLLTMNDAEADTKAVVLATVHRTGPGAEAPGSHQHSPLLNR